MKRTIAVALMLFFGGAPSAHADAAAEASATAIGVQATGPLHVSPAPAVAASQPPDSRKSRDGLLDEAAGPLTVRASWSVVAEASRESRIETPVFPELQDNARRRHFRVDTNNARALSEARGVVIASTSPGQAPLVEAAMVRANAVARCEANQAIFDSNFSVTGLRVLGRDTFADAVDLPVPGGAGPPVTISVKQGEPGKLPGGGVFPHGLHVTIPALNADVVVGRAEARMPSPCGTGKIVGEPTRLGTPVPTTPPRRLLPVAAAVTALVLAAGAVTRLAWRAAPGRSR